MIRKGNAKLRYYMHCPDPDSLSDEAWACMLRELEWIWEQEAKAQKNVERKT